MCPDEAQFGPIGGRHAGYLAPQARYPPTLWDFSTHLLRPSTRLKGLGRRRTPRNYGSGFTLPVYLSALSIPWPLPQTLWRGHEAGFGPAGAPLWVPRPSHFSWGEPKSSFKISAPEIRGPPLWDPPPATAGGSLLRGTDDYAPCAKGNTIGTSVTAYYYIHTYILTYMF